MYKLIITPNAQLDVSEAKDYFKKQKDGLEKKFIDDLKHTFSAIKLNPYYKIEAQNVRSIPLKKFRYKVFFVIHEDQKLVNIIAVFHTSLNPSKYPT